MQREFHVRQQVHAPVSKVWARLIDVATWHEWTPTVIRTELLSGGALGVGSRVRIRQPRLGTAVWEVTRWEHQRRFEWQNRKLGVRIVGDHVVDQQGDACSVSLTIRFEGALAGVAEACYGRLTAQYLRLEADGLKTVFEGGLIA
jgi:hypothetical protein